jgi:hypothetical protein
MLLSAVFFWVSHGREQGAWLRENERLLLRSQNRLGALPKAQTISALPEPNALLGTASLTQAKAAGLSWRWRVNKQQPARLLFGLTDSDLNGVLGTIVSVSLRENEVVNGDWSVEKDILLTTIKTGDSSQVKLEEKSISPLSRFQQAGSLGTTLESWQQINSQTQPVTLSSAY